MQSVLGLTLGLVLACAPEPGVPQESVAAANGIQPPAGLDGVGSSEDGTAELTIDPSPTSGVEYKVEQTLDGELWTTSYQGLDLKPLVRVEEEGVYGFRAQACIGDVCSGPTAPITVVIGFKFPSYLQSACPAPLGAAPAQENLGALAAEAGVSGGSATYQVGITLPPGRMGMTPSVGLSYASRQGDGLLGVGWSMGAASAIARCGRSPYYDYETRGVDFSSADRLCLDGQRLVLASGTYGQDGARYRTESESFSRITQHGNMQLGSSWFEVETKDGERQTYGYMPSRNDAVERLTGAGAPVAWWLARREDRQQNQVEYLYSRLGDATVAGQTVLGQHLLTSIRYTGKPGVSGDRVVEFEYEDRPDKRSGYTAGALRRSVFRLAAVNASAQGKLTRRYELGYAQSRATERSLLTSVQECVANPCTPQTSMPATTFEYQDEAPVFEWVDVTTEETVQEYLGSDYDGDGTRDTFQLVYPDYFLGPPDEKTLALSGTNAILDLYSAEGRAWQTGFIHSEYALRTQGNPDLDQDGRADLMGFVAQPSSPPRFGIRANGNTKLSNLTSMELFPVDAPSKIGDFDGNGRTDILWSTQGGLRLWLQRDPPAGSATLVFDPMPVIPPQPEAREQVQQIADFDGNGLPDMFLDWSGAFPRLLDGYEPKIMFTERQPSGALSFRVASIPSLGGPRGPVMSDGSIPTSSFKDVGDGRFLDMNGDGLPDIVTGAGVYINMGGTFRDGLYPCSGGLCPDRQLVRRDAPVRVIDMDWDADGVTEQLVPMRDDVVLEWCYQPLPSGVDGAHDNLWSYCTFSDEDRGVRDFSSRYSDAPKQYDRTIYRWSASEPQDDGLGYFASFHGVPTGVVAALDAQADDYGGDGLMDVVSQLRLLRAGQPAPELGTPPPITGWYPDGTSLGTKVARNRSGAPDLMTRAVNGLGHATSWTHRPLSTPEPVDGCVSPAGLPFYRASHDAVADDHDHFIFTSSMNVVARFDSDNGIGGSNPTCYRYEDAMANNQGRGFLGFRQISEESALGDGLDLRTTTTFHQRGVLAGRPDEVKVQRASDPLSAKPLEHAHTEWGQSCRASADPTERAKVCFVWPQETYSTRRDPEGARVWVSTSTTVTSYTGLDREYGNVSRQELWIEDTTTRHHEVTINTFEYADAAAWWINRLARREVTKSSAEYLSPPLMPASSYPENAPKTVVAEYDYYADGHLAWSRLQRQVDVQKGVAHQWQRKVFDWYDAYGNLEQVTETAADVTGQVVSQWTFGWDGYFAASETNALNHSTTYLDVDLATGKPTQVKDALGNLMTSHFDAFGRLLDVTAPGRATAETRVVSCDAQCPEHGAYMVLARQHGEPQVTQVLDALGRVLQTRTTAFSGQSEVYTVTHFDARGHMVAQSQPSHDPKGAFFTLYEDFDVLGRPRRKVVDKTGYVDANGNPDETFVTEYRYHGLRTDIVLDGLRTASRTYNSLDQLIETRDLLGQRTYYRYDGLGLAILIEDPMQNALRAGWDELGRKLWADDPDRGLWTFEYDGRGLLRRQIDANQTNVQINYDALGRVEDRWVGLLRDGHYEYDAAGPGLLDRETKSDAQGLVVFERVHGYDGLGRPTETTTRFDGQSFTHRLAYDCTGKVRGQELPSGEAVDLTYTSHGYVKHEANPKSVVPGGFILRQVLEANPRGQVTRERFGNGLIGTYDYYGSTGQVFHQCVGPALDTACTDAVQDLGYEYEDPFSNLTSVEKTIHDPQSPVQAILEEYGYDTLFRLTSAKRKWTGSGQPDLAVGYAYDGLGNLTRKDDYASLYQYGDAARTNSALAGPHAVRQVTKPGGQVVSDFEYDKNGNQTRGDGRTIDYTWMNKPKEILERGIATAFAYDTDHARYRQETVGRLVRYAGSLFEQETLSGMLPTTTSFVGSSVVVKRDIRSRAVRYLHRDRLGSVETVTDEQGNLVEAYGYDPFGAPRTSLWEDTGGVLHNGEFASEVTTRGFTGHEHLDQHRLIHANGRAYDPVMGRFLSVDPFVVGAANLQAINPYSYMLNNPMSGTDPTGYIIETALDVASVAVGVASIAAWDENTSLGEKLLDGGGLALDVIAVAIPLVPGGASLLIKGAKAAAKLDDAADVARGADKAVDAAKGVEKAVDAADAAKGAGKAGDAAGAAGKVDNGAASASKAGDKAPSDVGSPSSKKEPAVDSVPAQKEATNGGTPSQGKSGSTDQGRSSGSTSGSKSTKSHKGQDPRASAGGAEHTKGARGSTKESHQAGKTRKKKDRMGEKADERRRLPNKKPRNWRGPWPPKN